MLKNGSGERLAGVFDLRLHGLGRGATVDLALGDAVAQVDEGIDVLAEGGVDLPVFFEGQRICLLYTSRCV